MTSTAVVKAEIARFLQSKEPEVIAISGEWGVGKTYTWNTELAEVRANKSYALGRYSYVSLFGISSLDSLKLAVFENLEFLEPPPVSAIDKGLQLANIASTNVKKLLRLAPALPYVGKVFDRAGPFYFSIVRNQIICIDDLERRSQDLTLKEVFGLISFLREQRACKVALLFNVDSLSEKDRSEFDTLFEKVIDAQLIFACHSACNIDPLSRGIGVQN
jgi:hypothetical protein